MSKEKVYLFDHSPHLRGEWDYSKNVGVDPEKLTYGIRKKVWWRCVNGHSWESPIYRRVSGTRCRYCYGTFVLTGESDLWTVAPELAKQLVDPQLGYTLSVYSNRKVEWKCARGHTWIAMVSHRTSGSACSYCSRSPKVLSGFNDLWTVAPELAEQLVDPELGYGLTASCSNNVSWVCGLGHTWNATVNNRRRGKGCPFCSNKRVLLGFNDLSTTHPVLASQLVDKKLGRTLAYGANQKVAWMCGLGHTWEAAVFSRTSSMNTGCPFCSNQSVLCGYNDLWTTDKKLASELADPEIGHEVTAHSGKNVMWKCGLGHIWKSTVGNRAAGRGCPQCSLQHTSKIEGRLRKLLSKEYNVLSDDHTYRLPVAYRKNKTMSVDIYFESCKDKVVCEYDGSYWHSGDATTSRDVDKTNALLEQGYKVIRLREQGQVKLPNLPIDHPNLLQIPLPYSFENGPLLETVEMIKIWLQKND